MLNPIRNNAGRSAVLNGASIPAPIEGWDAVSPLANMKPGRAIVLDNFFPREGYVELRKGWTEWSTTGETTPVESLMAYQSRDSSDDALFAAVNGKVFEVTSTGSSGAAVVTGLTNSRLQHVNFTTAGGHFLVFVNGQDSMRAWDGSAWSTPAITDATSADFIHVNSFKNRLFFAANDKLGFYYLPVDSIAGAASYFELGGVFSMGGYLMAMGTWTVDGGAGVDDHAIFISSRGQIAIYKGTDPNSADTWSLIGVFDGPAPIGRRCLRKVGGDNVIVSIEGVVPLSKSLILDKAAVRSATITQNISREMNDAARVYGTNFGWQIIGYPKGTMAILNVPVAESTTQYQYVMNTLSGAWARFKGMNANCWEVFNDGLYFGGNDGTVGLADYGSSDNGEDIVADMKTAFNYFGSRGSQKAFRMIRPVIVSDGRFNPGIKVNVDFKDEVPPIIAADVSTGALLWDDVDWDEVDWPANVAVTIGWKSSSAIGTCAAIRLRIVANSSSSTPTTLQVNSFDVLYEKGGYL